jgi:putative NADH-flavin reductase
MRILVLGATGATGRHLVEQALAQGHHVTALARNPAKLHSRCRDLTVVQGDVTDPRAVERSVRSQDAVLCALGSSTPLKHDAALVAGISNLVGAMERLHIRRLVYLSFLGVHDGRRQLSRLGKYIVAPLLMRKVAADHEYKETIIQRSTLDWVIVRPPRLTNGRRTGTYRSGAEIQATLVVPRVSRADLAEFMLRQLNGDTYVRKTPAVMY